MITEKNTDKFIDEIDISKLENSIHFDTESVVITGGAAKELKEILKQAEKYNPGISKDFIFLNEIENE